MEAKQRTEEQIKARMKKLGLSAASPAAPKETDDEDGDEGGDEEAEADGVAKGQEDNTEEDGVGNPGSAKPGLRKLKRKNQAESDDDSEGIFSSVEVCALDSPSLCRPAL